MKKHTLSLLFISLSFLQLLSQENETLYMNMEKPCYVLIKSKQLETYDIGISSIAISNKDLNGEILLILKASKVFTETSLFLKVNGKSHIIDIKYNNKPINQVLVITDDNNMKVYKELNKAMSESKETNRPKETSTNLTTTQEVSNMNTSKEITITSDIKKNTDVKVLESVTSTPVKKESDKIITRDKKEETANALMRKNLDTLSDLDKIKKYINQSKPNFIDGIKTEGVRFEFTKLYSYKKDIIMEFNLENLIGTDFVVDDIILEIVPKKQAKKSLSQSSIVEKEYITFNEVVKSNESKIQTIKAKDFIIRNDEVLIIRLLEFNEQGRGRNITMNISDAQFRKIKNL